MILNNPHLKKLLNRLLHERIQEVKDKGENSNSQLLSKKVPSTIPNTRKVIADRSNNKNTGNRLESVKVIKSPSDTTIYVPALSCNLGIGDGLPGIAQGSAVNAVRVIRNQVTNANDVSQKRSNGLIEVNSRLHEQQQPELITKISNFVDQMHLNSRRKQLRYKKTKRIAKCDQKYLDLVSMCLD